MLTRLTIRNFKRFGEVAIELGNPVVFIGPNNSGKTTALQALALWDLGVRRWNEKRAGKTTPEKRPGVTINRRDLIQVPVPTAYLLWKDLHVRDIDRSNGKLTTRNVRIDIIVEGVTNSVEWKCGIEFDYANEESFYCRPMRLSDVKNPARMPVPESVAQQRVAFLPPMSGLIARETRYDEGAINVRIGEGRTAEVLRNLCYRILSSDDETTRNRWQTIVNEIERLFGDRIETPAYIKERGEVGMTFRTKAGVRLDISSAGRGLQQTLLLLAHLAVNPGAVLLLDEPDAHLEILRQRQIYRLLTDAAREQGSQIIAASHSEVILNEAADRDVVVAFLGKPHRIDDRGGQVLKSLKEIGFEQFYQAEQTGWVMYLEGATDLAILRAFAERLQHPALSKLDRVFLHSIGNVPSKARDHFHGLREAKPDLVGFVLCDRDAPPPHSATPLTEHRWARRETENYLCQPATLEAFAAIGELELSAGPLFDETASARRVEVMQECIKDRVPPVALRDTSDPWWQNVKASDDFLDLVFADFYRRLHLPNLMRKTDYHKLARHVPPELIADEVRHVLDQIAEVAARAVAMELA